MYNKMLCEGIPAETIATSMQDGPKCEENSILKMNEVILQDHQDFQHLIDLTSCIIHTVHNASGKGIEQYIKVPDQLCMDLYSLFKYSAARHEHYKKYEIEVELYNFQNTQEYSGWIWVLQLKRNLEQQEAITHFVAELAKDPKRVPMNIHVWDTMLGTKSLIRKLSLGITQEKDFGI